MKTCFSLAVVVVAIGLCGCTTSVQLDQRAIETARVQEPVFNAFLARVVAEPVRTCDYKHFAYGERNYHSTIDNNSFSSSFENALKGKAKKLVRHAGLFDPHEEDNALILRLKWRSCTVKQDVTSTRAVSTIEYSFETLSGERVLTAIVRSHGSAGALKGASAVNNKLTRSLRKLAYELRGALANDPRPLELAAIDREDDAGTSEKVAAFVTLGPLLALGRTAETTLGVLETAASSPGVHAALDNASGPSYEETVEQYDAVTSKWVKEASAAHKSKQAEQLSYYEKTAREQQSERLRQAEQQAQRRAEREAAKQRAEQQAAKRRAERQAAEQRAVQQATARQHQAAVEEDRARVAAITTGQLPEQTTKDDAAQESPDNHQMGPLEVTFPNEPRYCGPLSAGTLTTGSFRLRYANVQALTVKYKYKLFGMMGLELSMDANFKWTGSPDRGLSGLSVVMQISGSGGTGYVEHLFMKYPDANEGYGVGNSGPVFWGAFMRDASGSKVEAETAKKIMKGATQVRLYKVKIPKS